MKLIQKFHYKSRIQTTQVLLNVAELEPRAENEWLYFLDFIAEAIHIKIVVGKFEGDLQDQTSEFAFVSSSRALSRKLLLNFPLIYIQPSSAPDHIDTHFFWKSLGKTNQSCRWHPAAHKVTLISSVYNGDEFLSGFLHNCKALDEYGGCEHFLIRAGSPGSEHDLLIEHVRLFPSAVYINLIEDPGLYEVWNLGSMLATSRYLSNANIDDRRAPEHVTRLSQILDNELSIAAASSALRISKHKNLAWDDSEGCEVWFADVGENNVGVDDLFEQRPEGIVSHNFLHCMPLWRRSLHALIGGFDEKRYGPSADWAFWLRAGMKGAKFRCIEKPMGLYLKYESSYWRRDSGGCENDKLIVDEFFKWKNCRERKEKDLSSRFGSRSLSEQISAIIEMFQTGAVIEGLGRLLSIAQHSDRLRSIDVDLLNRTAAQFLGCREFSRLAVRFQDSLEAGHLFELAMFDLLAELISGLESPSRKVHNVLELACIDISEWGGDIKGLFLLGLFARKKGDFDFEDSLLRYLVDSDRDLFYKTVMDLRWTGMFNA